MMNEQLIKDLWWKARIGYNNQACDPEVLEKLAELIVKECVNQALEEKVSEEEINKEDDIEDRCYLRGNNSGIVDAVIRIKQHFGVEE